MNPEKNAQFREILQNKYDEKYKKLITGFPSFIQERINPVYSATIDRMNSNIHLMKYIYPITEPVYNCTVFKITRRRYDKKLVADNKRMKSPQADYDYDSTTAVYAYIYSDNKDNFKYFCFGPTFRSQDGEYRGRFLPFSQLEKIEKEFEKPLEQVEEFVVEKMQKDEFEFHADFCFAKDYPRDIRKFQDKINNTRLVIRLFMLCWFCDFYRIYMKIAENHINPAYQNIIFDKEDIPVFNTVAKLAVNMDEISHLLLQAYIPNFTSYGNKKIDTGTIPIYTGQKILPMTIHEAYKIDDVSFPSWRELHITNECAGLFASFISPSFPVVNDWFYIQNAHAGVFDNYSQYEKYADSKMAKDIGDYLKEADRLTYLNASLPTIPSRKKPKKKGGGGGIDTVSATIQSSDDQLEGIIADATDTKQKKYKNAKFDGLSRKINGAILYGESAIRLSDALLCIHMEQVGRTLRDVPTLLVSLEDRAPSGYFDIFTRIETFARHMFDAVYAFYCMNTKLLMMHGDAHLNNVTIFKQYNYFAKNKLVYPHLAPSRIVYAVNNREDEVVGDNFGEVKNPVAEETTFYMFEQRGLYTMLIDFSRGIIADRRHIVKNFGEIFTEHYMKKQNIRVLKMIEHYFPSFYDKEKNALEIAVRENFSLVFKAISAIDTYTVASGMVNVFAVERDLKTHPMVVKFANKLKNMSEELILTNLNNIISRKIASTEELQWPNYLILLEVFDDFKLVSGDAAVGQAPADIMQASKLKYKNERKIAGVDANIVVDDMPGMYKPIPEDIFIADSFSSAYKLIYSFKNYDDYPPLMKFDSEEEAAIEIGEQPKPWIEESRKNMRMEMEAKERIIPITEEYKSESYIYSD